MLMLFAFMMCLSCLSSSAIGSGVFYACTDGTMSPGDFDIKKCTNFGFNDIIQGTETITGVDTSIDTSEDIVVDPGTDLLVVGRPLGLDDEDPNATFLDFFGTGKNVQPSGLGTVAHSVTNKAECAKICYENEVEMRGEGLECNGFVSDGFSKCMLYPSTSTVAGSSLTGGEKSYGLKRTRGGLVHNIFTVENLKTEYGAKGGPKSYGNLHDVTCKGDDGVNGALQAFKWQNSGSQTRNLYTCLQGSFGGIGSQKSTPHGPSGSTHKCNKDRNEFSYLSAGNGIGDVDCGDQFIHRWKLNQWSQSMNISFNCTNDETSDESQCIELETDGDINSRACNTGELSDTRVRCPANTALTKFKWVGGSKINYRCCPKPSSSVAGRSLSRASAANSTALNNAAAAAAAAKSCQPKKNTRGATSSSCDSTTQLSCNINLCDWR